MPKRVMSAAVPTWCATGLSLGAAGAVLNGVATLLAVLIAGVVVYALQRLQSATPEARSTADLVGSVLGAAPARFTALLQLTAYTIMAAAAGIGLGILSFYRAADPMAALASWWWPALSVAAVAVAAALVTVLSTRIIGAITAVLAVVGLLVYFYLALAITTEVYAGTPPVPVGGPQYFPSTLYLIATLIPLGLALTGFEVAGVVSGRLRSVARPLATALVLVAVCAAMSLVAVNVASVDGFHYRADAIATLAGEFFGTQANTWLLAGSVPLSCAAILALMWAATRVAGQVFGTGATTSALVAVAAAALAVVLCRFNQEIGGLLVVVAAMLLLVVYLLVAQANSRLTGPPAAVQGPRVVLVVTAVAVVLIPLGAHDFLPVAWWPVGVTVVVLAIAAVVSGVARRRAQ